MKVYILAENTTINLVIVKMTIEILKIVESLFTYQPLFDITERIIMIMEVEFSGFM